MRRARGIGVLLAALLQFTAVVSARVEAGKDLSCEVTSLRRQDLPDEFPFQIFEAGFAVLRIRCRNQSGASLLLDPAEIQVFGPGKKKPLQQAEATDVAPRLVKYYVRSGGVHPTVFGEARSGYPYPPDPNRARYEAQRPGVGIPGHAGQVDAGTGEALRSLLESYRLEAVHLEPEEETEGYLYLESKKRGNALSGGFILIHQLRFGF